MVMMGKKSEAVKTVVEINVVGIRVNTKDDDWMQLKMK